MRRLLVIALATAAVAPVAPVAAPAASYKSCGGGFNPDGSKGSFYRSIRAKGISCATAKAITRAWVRYEAMHDGANPTGKVRVKGYRCSGKASKSSGDGGSALSVVCVRGAKAVRFLGHP